MKKLNELATAVVVLGAAVGSSAPSLAADGPLAGLLECGASPGIPSDAGFSAPVTLHIQGTSVTWSRESADVREIVSGTLVGNRVALDGYGGNIAPQTRQAGWDWKLRGTLTFADGAASGDIQILSKDGGSLQRQCRFSTAAAVPGVAAVPATVPAAPPPAPVGGVGQGGASSSGADVAGQAAAVFGRVAGALLQPGGAGLGGLVGQVVQGAPGPRPSPANMGAVAAGAFNAGPLQGAPTPYSSKAAFLGAARSGQLLGVAKMTDGSRDVITLVNAVSTILGSEYGVPRLPARSPDCSLQYATHVYQLLHAITEREATSLSDQPPSFRQAGRNYGDTVEQVTSYIHGGRNCDADGFGARQPHPYKAALLAFGGEYQLATRAYIEDEARSRASTYAQRQAEAAAEDQKQRDLAARQEAALRAAEQRRIDAENARIRAEEERRKEIQRNRVGG